MLLARPRRISGDWEGCQESRKASRVVYSDDHGLSWRLGSPVSYPLCNESQVVELADGSLMINYRIQQEVSVHPGRRGTAISRLLLSNLDSRPGPGKVRRKMAVRLSYDEGQTWPVARLIDPGRAAYSCPAVLPDGRITLLYECGEESANERIHLARFSLEWLTKGEDIASERT